MNYRTYGSLMNKVEMDLDLQDETFIQSDEMVGYCNEAIKEAYAEILTLRQDYFLTHIELNMVAGVSLFSFPANMYANKMRGLVYHNGSIVYNVHRYKKRFEFIDIAYTEEFGASDIYRYIYRNDAPGNPQFQLWPKSRDNGQFLHLWYLREANRVPLIGEFYNTEPVLPSAVSGNVITVAAGTQPSAAGFSYNPIAYVTGDQVQVFVDPLTPNSALPGGLSSNTTYYVIAVSSTTISLASSLANAQSNTPITLTSTGTGRFVIQVAGTEAIQQAQLIDIPEFYEFLIQWMKVRCLEKEGDPRYEAAVVELQGQRKMMVDTLVEIVEDEFDQVEADFTLYQEMS